MTHQTFFERQCQIDRGPKMNREERLHARNPMAPPQYAFRQQASATHLLESPRRKRAAARRVPPAAAQIAQDRIRQMALLEASGDATWRLSAPVAGAVYDPHRSFTVPERTLPNSQPKSDDNAAHAVVRRIPAAPANSTPYTRPQRPQQAWQPEASVLPEVALGVAQAPRHKRTMVPSSTARTASPPLTPPQLPNTAGMAEGRLSPAATAYPHGGYVATTRDDDPRAQSIPSPREDASIGAVPASPITPRARKVGSGRKQTTARPVSAGPLQLTSTEWERQNLKHRPMSAVALSPAAQAPSPPRAASARSRSRSTHYEKQRERPTRLKAPAGASNTRDGMQLNLQAGTFSSRMRGRVPTTVAVQLPLDDLAFRNKGGLSRETLMQMGDA